MMSMVSKTCRFCLTVNMESSVNLTDQGLLPMLAKVFYFQIALQPELPSQICAPCRQMVEQFYVYVGQVSRNQELLNRKLLRHANRIGDNSEPQNDAIKIESEHLIKVEPTTDGWFDETNALESVTESRSQWDALSLDDQKVRESLPESDVDDPAGIDRKKCKKTLPADGKRNSPGKGKRDPSIVDESVLRHYKLSCDLCSKSLVDFSDLRKHYKYVHNEQAYLKCCDKKIFKKCWMVEHIQLHLNPNAFHCAICDKSYSSSKVLKEHTKEVHSALEDRSFPCETCRKAFVSRAHLNAHIMVAHGSVPCPNCGKVLASQGSLKKHMLAMHGEGEKHVCDICARVFRSKQCFEKHVKDHQGTRYESKVQCSVCSVWLTDKYCLTKHTRRMHVQPSEVVACELCGKEVRNQDALKCHMRRAHMESRFECELCHKKFKRPHHMREHIAIHHTGEDLYDCKHCPERFNTKNKQYMHRKTVHPDQYVEEMRKRTFKV